jgi:hypothetical protein
MKLAAGGTYVPEKVVGATGIEPVTPAMSTRVHITFHC